MIDGVVFDLDGLLLDSEQVWDTAREELAKERGGRWHPQAQREMMGMSSPEWARQSYPFAGTGVSGMTLRDPVLGGVRD